MIDTILRKNNIYINCMIEYIKKVKNLKWYLIH